MRQPQLFGKQIQYPVVLTRVFTRQFQVLGRLLQGVQMAFACQPGRFGAGIPARDVQEFGAQRIQARAALGGDAQFAGARHESCG
ncbi:hypothetical protein D3C72_1017110 [compost metagenome]